MRTVLFSGGFVYSTEERRFLRADILCKNGQIAEIGSFAALPAGCETIDCTGCYLTPGFVDVHTHGRGGHDFNQIEAEDVLSMRRAYAAAGTTTLLATLASAEPDALYHSIDVLAECRSVTPGMATIGGVHLEGRYLNPDKRGAHAPSLLAPLSGTELASFLRRMAPAPMHVSAALEMEGGDAFLHTALENGATVGLAHSNATYAQSMHFVEEGLRSFTHTCNAMRAIHHREPGNAVAAMLADDAYAECICDGMHLHPGMVRLLCREKPRDRFVLVTDSMEAAGCADGTYTIAGMPVIVQNGRAQTTDGALAGSTLDLYHAVSNCMEFCNLSFAETLPFATANPADMVHLDSVCGRLLPGLRADILLFSSIEAPFPAPLAVYCAGEKVL